MNKSVNCKSENFLNNEIHSYQFKYRIKKSENKGYGIFAINKIHAKHEIMSCVTKDLSETRSDSIPFSLAQYLFVNPDRFSLETPERSYVMVLGEMVFLNHSDQPNCKVRWEMRENGLYYAQLIANQTIQEDEEITIRYTDANDYWDKGYFQCGETNA